MLKFVFSLPKFLPSSSPELDRFCSLWNTSNSDSYTKGNSSTRTGHTSYFILTLSMPDSTPLWLTQSCFFPHSSSRKGVLDRHVDCGQGASSSCHCHQGCLSCKTTSSDAMAFLQHLTLHKWDLVWDHSYVLHCFMPALAKAVVVLFQRSTHSAQSYLLTFPSPVLDS